MANSLGLEVAAWSFVLGRNMILCWVGISAFRKSPLLNHQVSSCSWDFPLFPHFTSGRLMFALHSDIRGILLETCMSLFLNTKSPDKDSREMQIPASFILPD